MSKCSILGCNQEFNSKEKTRLHEATDWHCISCGHSDNTELTINNVGTACDKCLNVKSRCIRVDFKRKAYVVNGVLSIKEKGRWVHYE